MRPVHYDVDQIVAATERMIEEGAAKARRAAKTPADVQLVELQVKLFGVIPIYERAFLEALNASTDAAIAGQAASSTVMYVMSHLKDNWPPEAISTFCKCMAQFANADSAADMKGYVIIERSSPGTVGGSA